MSNTSDGDSLWLLWVLANAIGGLVGCCIGSFLAIAVGSPDLFTAKIIVFDVTLGATIGFAQWLVIRQWVRADYWMLASAGSWCIAWPINGPFSYLLGFLPAVVTSWLDTTGLFLPVSFIVGGSGLGAVVGLTQWLILKLRRVHRASLWLVTNIVGYALAQVLACMCLFVTTSVELSQEVSGCIYVVILVTVSAVSTGGTLKQLLHQPRRTR